MGRSDPGATGARLSFLGEIKRRHVFRVAVAYAVVAWVIVQVVDVLKEPLRLPSGFDTVVVVLVAIGLPITLVLAWAFDLTDAGVVRTAPSSTEPATEPSRPAMRNERWSSIPRPTFGMAHLLLAASAGVLGRHQEALTHVQLAEGLLRDSVNPAWISQFGICNAQLGRRTEVERYHRRLEELARTHRIPNTAWVQMYVALGDDGRAIEWLETVAEEAESYVGHFATWVIKFNVYRMPILDLPRSREIRERLGFRS